MHEYDISLKLLLRSSGTETIRKLTSGAAIERWLDVEMPEVRNTRVDLLGETSDGDLLHVELQSSNDRSMPLRMAEYCLRVYRLFGRFAHQILLYVGEPPLRMATSLEGSDISFRYEAVDIRDLDGDVLLESRHIGDNVMAILARLSDSREAVHRVLDRISGLDRPEREIALRQLITLAGLRHMEQWVEQEARKMPLLDDIMDNKVLGRERKLGFQEGELTILRGQIEHRFGPIPSWVEERLASYSAAELQAASLRLLGAKSLEELLQ